MTATASQSLAAMCHLSSLLLAAVPAVPTAAERIVFPSDPSVLNLKGDFGAKGDGVADDTAVEHFRPSDGAIP